MLCVFAVARFRARRLERAAGELPPVSIIKPLYGLEKNLLENLRSTCHQDYPDFEVVLSFQRHDDPALPIARQVESEFPAGRVRIVVNPKNPGPNGKISNMAGAWDALRHPDIVISDSDTRLRPDYLRAIVPPLADRRNGCVCTLYKAAEAQSWFEKIELLTLNADFIPNVIFTYETRIAFFCLGASTAIRRETMEEIGGLESLADYLVEDYEMGNRMVRAGKRVHVVPYIVDTMVDLKTPSQCWKHIVYWDQNTRAANPIGLLLSVIIRAVPFSLLFAIARLFDPLGLAVLAGATLVRLVTSAIILGWGLRDWEGVRALYLLPARDVAGLVSWVLAFTQRTTTWRGTDFILTRDGRLRHKDAPAGGAAS